jgi:hypothetical protein
MMTTFSLRTEALEPAYTKARIKSGLPCSLLFIRLQLFGFSKTSYVQYYFPAFAVGGEGNGKKRDEV